MTPQEIVSELDRHIVGQQGAKRAVDIALPSVAPPPMELSCNETVAPSALPCRIARAA